MTVQAVQNAQAQLIAALASLTENYRHVNVVCGAVACVYPWRKCSGLYKFKNIFLVATFRTSSFPSNKQTTTNICNFVFLGTETQYSSGGSSPKFLVCNFLRAQTAVVQPCLTRAQENLIT